MHPLSRCLTSTATATHLLSLKECQQADTRNLDDLKADTRNIADGVARTTEACNQNLVVLVAKVQATVSGDERGDLLAVLDELDAHAFTNGRVRLLGLDADLFQHDALGHTCAHERVGLQMRDAVALVELLGRPSLHLAHARELATGLKTGRLSAFSGRRT
jgi:hypothetical protein